MKKILALLCLCSGISWASYQPITGSSVTVFATQGGAIPVSGTFFQGTQPVSVTASTIGVVGVGGTYSTSGSTVTIIPTQGGSIPVTGTFFQGTQPVSVIASTIGVVSAGGNFSTTGSTITIIPTQGGSIPVTGNFFQATQPISVIASTIGVVSAGGTFSTTGSTITIVPTQGGSIPVTGSFSTTVNFLSTATVASAVPSFVDMGGVRVASITMPTAALDGTAQNISGSQIGQVMVTGIPFGLIKYATATITASTTETVFISSAAANNYTYLCGCAVTNTSATFSSLTIRQSGGPGSAINTNQLLIGVPATDVRGIWPGCANPFYRSALASNITLTGSASVTSLEVRCQYYTGT